MRAWLLEGPARRVWGALDPLLTWLGELPPLCSVYVRRRLLPPRLRRRRPAARGNSQCSGPALPVGPSLMIAPVCVRPCDRVSNRG
jgi:hypothetical protein